jgi:hypothetical protein
MKMFDQETSLENSTTAKGFKRYNTLGIKMSDVKSVTPKNNIFSGKKGYRKPSDTQRYFDSDRHEAYHLLSKIHKKFDHLES